MNTKQRYRLGFTLGKWEHDTREAAYLCLVVGMVFLSFGLYLDTRWMLIASFSTTVLCLILETISYTAHRLEKKTMDKIRHGGVS